MDFKKIHELLVSNNENRIDEGSNALFDAIDKNLIKYFQSKWRLSKEEGEDISQIAMLKIIQKAHSVSQPEKFERWCWMVAKNKARDNWRKGKKEQEVIDYNSELVDDSQIQIDQNDTSDKNECVSVGFKNFKKKYPEHAYALELKEDDCPIKEISWYIDRTPTATKEFLNQCRKKLAPFIKHCLNVD